MPWSKPSRRELIVLATIVAAGVALRLAYVIATQDHTLVGDEIEYDREARFAADGKFLWSTTPTGEPHASTWKTPGYPAWVGLLYILLGEDPDRVLAVQAVVFGALTMGLTWLLARRLFGIAAGLVAVAIVAVYPNAWQFEVRLFSEGMAAPLTMLALLLVLTATTVTLRRAAVVGVVFGLLVLVKPSSLVLVAPIAVMWWGASGALRGTGRLAITGAVALLVVVPWSIRNYTVDSEHFVPLSTQGAAPFGTFNDDAANDEEHPWAWRPMPSRDRDLLRTVRSEGELYEALQQRTREYIEENPSSLVKALYYNGITRFWDLRSLDDALAEVPFHARTRSVATVGIIMYWILLVLAVAGLTLAWRQGRRRLVLAVAALVVAATLLYTTEGTTRYRAPLEPFIVVLAAAAIAPRLERPVRERLAGQRTEAVDLRPQVPA